MPTLTMATQEEYFVTLTLFLRGFQTSHIFLKTLPLLFFAVIFSRVGTVDQTKLLRLLVGTSAIYFRSRVGRREQSDG